MREPESSTLHEQVSPRVRMRTTIHREAVVYEVLVDDAVVWGQAVRLRYSRYAARAYMAREQERRAVQEIQRLAQEEAPHG